MKKNTISRRDFFKKSAVLTAVAATPTAVIEAAENRLDEKIAYQMEQIPITLTINGVERKINVEPRVTLLDLLREQLGLTGTKKGCDHGQCGACTVHVDGKRINACLTLAVMQNGKSITTIEGLAQGDELHPMQAAFVKHDGFHIREYMSGNLCRCGAYPNIVNAIKEVTK